VSDSESYELELTGNPESPAPKSWHWDGPLICNECDGVNGTVRLCDIKCYMEKGSTDFHVNTIIHLFGGLLPSDIRVLNRCHLDRSAVHL
jgi:hypothetical protein